MPFGIGIPELIVIGAVAVLLFGSRLPEVARNVGASYQQFRKGLYEIQNTLKKDLDTDLGDVSSSNSNSYSSPYNNQRDYQQDYDPQPPQFIPPPEDESVESESLACQSEESESEESVEASAPAGQSGLDRVDDKNLG